MCIPSMRSVKKKKSNSKAKLHMWCLVLVAVMVFVLPLVSAEKINTPIDINIHCSNSTYLNISYIKYTSDSYYILNKTTSSVNLGNGDYRYTINQNLNNRTGDIEYTYVCDINGVQNGFGNIINVSLYNSAWIWITLTVIAFLFLFGSFIVDEELLIYLSGIFFLGDGIYIMIYGIDVLSVSDLSTKIITYSFIGIGLLFTLGAYVFNKFSNSRELEEEY